MAARDEAVLVLPDGITPADLPGLCEQLRGLVEATRATVVVCDAGAVSAPDGATVDALARLELAARRAGGRVRVAGGSPELARLLAFAGLEDVVRLGSPPEESVRPG